MRKPAQLLFSSSKSTACPLHMALFVILVKPRIQRKWLLNHNWWLQAQKRWERCPWTPVMQAAHQRSDRGRHYGESIHTLMVVHPKRRPEFLGGIPETPNCIILNCFPILTPIVGNPWPRDGLPVATVGFSKGNRADQRRSVGLPPSVAWLRSSP